MGAVEEQVASWTCATLGCAPDELDTPVELDAGLNNRSYLVTVGTERYVCRVPGPGTELFVDRVAEHQALEVARELSLDKTYVCMDDEAGWKISRFLNGARKLDYGNEHDVEQAVHLLRGLHISGRTIPATFDFIADREQLLDLLKHDGGSLDETDRELDALACKLEGFLRSHESAPVFCHNDFYSENILIANGEMQLIDWEYAAMGQGIFDIANFIAQGSGYAIDEALSVLDLYYQRPASSEEQSLCLAATAFIGCYWYFWARCKALAGDPVDAWLTAYEQAARRFGPAACAAVERCGH